MVLGTILFSPWGIFILAIVIVGVLILILTLIERGLSKKLIYKKLEEHSFSNRLRKLETIRSRPKEYLEQLDALSREFFTTALHVDGSSNLSDLNEMFEKIGDTEVAKYCNRLQEALYSGEDIDDKRVDYLTRNFAFLIDRENKKHQEVNALTRKHKVMQILPAQQKQMVRTISPDAHKETVIDQRVISYLDEGIHRGYNIELLRKNLLKGGFPDEMIHLAERYIRNVHHNALNKPKHNDSTKQLDSHKETILQKQLDTSNKSEPQALPRPTSTLVVSPSTDMKKEEKPAQKESPIVNKKITLLSREHDSHPLQRAPQSEVHHVSAAQDIFIQGVSKIDENIVRIIKEGRKRGFEMALLKKKLLERGFDEGEITRAIHAVEDAEEEVAPIPQKKPGFFARLFGRKNKQPEINPAIMTILVEGQKRGFDMALLKKKLLERGFNEREIKQAMESLPSASEGAKKKKKNEIEEVDILPFQEKDIRKHVSSDKKTNSVSLPRLPKLPIVPPKKPEVKQTRSRGKASPESIERVGSMDDLERLRNKISSQKASGWESIGDRGKYHY